MNICMLAYTFYENDNRVMRYAESLAKRGDSVDVIALKREGQGAFETISGVNVYRIQRRTVNERAKLLYFFKLLWFLIKSATFLSFRHVRKPYDVVHVHSVPDYEVFAAWLPKITGSKILLDIHDIVPEFYASKFKVSSKSFIFKLLVWVERASIAFCDHVIIANHIWYDRLISRSVSESKCSVILNYPDPDIFYKRARTKNNGNFIMIYPGTLNWHQGLDIAIKAFAIAKDQIPEAEFHIYGEGSSKPELIGLVSDLGLEGKVFFKESVPMRKIADVIANSDLGIVPKRAVGFGNEAFSTKIFEFMALGVPVIVSNTEIDQYYFDDSVVKFFESGNEHDLAKSMLLLHKDRQLRERLVSNAFKCAGANSWKAKESEYLNLLGDDTNPESYLTDVHPVS